MSRSVPLHSGGVSVYTGMLSPCSVSDKLYRSRKSNKRAIVTGTYLMICNWSTFWSSDIFINCVSVEQQDLWACLAPQVLQVSFCHISTSTSLPMQWWSVSVIPEDNPIYNNANMTIKNLFIYICKYRKCSADWKAKKTINMFKILIPEDSCRLRAKSWGGHKFPVIGWIVSYFILSLIAVCVRFNLLC